MPPQIQGHPQMQGHPLMQGHPQYYGGYPASGQSLAAPEYSQAAHAGSV
jgi:hypothetical protein